MFWSKSILLPLNGSNLEDSMLKSVCLPCVALRQHQTKCRTNTIWVLLHWRKWRGKSRQLLDHVGTTESIFSSLRKQCTTLVRDRAFSMTLYSKVSQLLVYHFWWCNVVITEHEEEYVIELANEVRKNLDFFGWSEGIVEVCGFSCTSHDSSSCFHSSKSLCILKTANYIMVIRLMLTLIFQFITESYRLS